MSETNGNAPERAPLMVELDERGGDPIVFEVVALDEEFVSITMTAAESQNDDAPEDVRVTLIARPEDVCHEIDKAALRPSRAPIVNPAVEQEFSAPFDVVTIAKRLSEPPTISMGLSIESMSRQLRGVRAFEEGKPVFDLECTVVIPLPGGKRKAHRGSIRTIPGTEVTVTALRLTAELVADVMRKLDKGQVLR